MATDGYQLMNLVANMYGNGNQMSPPDQMDQSKMQMPDELSAPQPGDPSFTGPVQPGAEGGTVPGGNMAAAPRTTDQQGDSSPVSAETSAPAKNYAGMQGIRGEQGSVFKNPYHF